MKFQKGESTTVKRRPLILAAFAFGVSCLCVAQKSNDPKAVNDEPGHNAAQALSAQDWKTLHSLESADLQTVDRDGNWFKSAEEAKRDEENLKVISTITNLDVRVYGDAAVAIYDNEIKSTYKDRDVSAPTVETDVWVRSGKGWKMVSVQVTKKSSAH